ncbi:unnamed protein product [Acanthoscelides obtectus]|uniref:Uncharacterized protein n=1 Tax=Acanthoscelides obtectus TaxID=200917 RepID=A0A9P0PLB5_ACAOB|nr:unnamed protein product [Acanthoscelides obtectus]CAK1646865.1 hypothetical protein AOBTE_LOCUS14900 [Acanthoscelides obtectus]
MLGLKQKCIHNRIKKTHYFSLQYLAIGDTFYTIVYSFTVGCSTISAIVIEVYEAICKHLQNRYLLEPTTEIWQKSEEGFRNLWQFLNCTGSIDGREEW